MMELEDCSASREPPLVPSGKESGALAPWELKRGQNEVGLGDGPQPVAGC
jgi:hypothetical protein